LELEVYAHPTLEELVEDRPPKPRPPA